MWYPTDHLPFCLCVWYPHILQTALTFALSLFPECLLSKNINSVLYGWLDGRSKLLLFWHPHSFSWISLKNTSNWWMVEGHKRAHTNTQTPVVACVTFLVRGNQGCLSWRLICFALSFFCLSSCHWQPGGIILKRITMCWIKCTLLPALILRASGVYGISDYCTSASACYGLQVD